MTAPTVDQIMDAAAAAREVATFTALALIAAHGDTAYALQVCDEAAELVRPESITELDCAGIAAQAIRDALALRGGA